jgi:hypothetical protein
MEMARRDATQFVGGAMFVVGGLRFQLDFG